MKFYEYTHVVTFEETNLVGNVYYVNHLSWQGKCRELFLRDKVPEVMEDLSHSLRLVTTSCSCEYYGELAVWDEVSIRMTLSEIVQNRISLTFEYWKVRQPPLLVARGRQEVACMQFRNGDLTPSLIPEALASAMLAYRNRVE